VLATTTHPDATAFTARFLARPDDRLGRLVFADWLDEQGGEANHLWARYLRYMVHAEEDFDGVYRERAASLGRAVRARLTLGGVPGNSLLPWLTAFLPDNKIWVRLGGRRVQNNVWDAAPLTAWVERGAVPIGSDEQNVYVVTWARVGQLEWVRESLTADLHRPVVLFRGEWADMRPTLFLHLQERIPGFTTTAL
jgi:uncharacterized protein (TIGR02996 family)